MPVMARFVRSYDVNGVFEVA